MKQLYLKGWWYPLDSILWIKIHDIRRIKKENLNPMVHSLFDEGSFKGQVQVKVMSLGSLSWINAFKDRVYYKEGQNYIKVFRRL